jgi:DNA-binding NarL/FixJ family response regulator
MSTPILIAIADDHALFRQGLKSLLLLQPEIEVVAEVERASQLETTIAATRCDVLLLDMQMDRWMMDEIPRLAKRASVIVLTASESGEKGVQALRMGARAVVHKRFAIETLMTAIRTVHEGLVWMPPTVQAEFAAEGTASVRRLTARELEIVRFVAGGKHNAEVAEKLSITESTVKSHLNKIFQKLGVRDRMQLAHYAIKIGLIPVNGEER